MFRNTPLASKSAYQIALGFGLCTVASIMLYSYFRRSDEEDELELSAKEHAQLLKSASKSKQQSLTKKLLLENEQVPLVMGRNGANLTAIEEKTATKIEFRAKNDTHQFCYINGSEEAVEMAAALIQNELARTASQTELILVSALVFGKITGLQEISRKSLAKIDVELVHDNQAGDNARLTITGTRSQVGIARALLEAKIREAEELQRAIEEVELHREPRRSPTNSACSSMHSSQNSLNAATNPRDKLLHSKAEGKEMEVYVSALASPSKFWVHIIGPQMEKLDNLVRDMTNYYDVPDNRLGHLIAEPYVGQIVAALYKYDNKWYRAEIVAILPNEYDANATVIDLYFVDYGDSEYAAPDEVFELRTDFLTLRFQAVECFLANIKPISGTKWEQNAIDLFQDRTAVAQWKKLIARVVTYEDRAKTSASNPNAEVRESSPVPGLELYDCSDDYELDIGLLLVAEGLAVEETATTRAQTSIKEIIQPPNEPVNGNSNVFTADVPLDTLSDQKLAALLKQKNSPLNGNSISAAKITPLQLNGDDKSNGNIDNGNSENRANNVSSNLNPDNWQKLTDLPRKT